MTMVEKERTLKQLNQRTKKGAAIEFGEEDKMKKLKICKV